MIKAISYWAMKDGLAGTHPIDDALACAADAGFAGMELCMSTEGALTTKASQAECEKIRSMAESAGVICETLASLTTWGCNPVSEDPKVREQALANNSAILTRAAWLGCKAVLYVPGVVRSPISPAETVRYDNAIERAAESIKRLLDVAEKVGVDLCVENVWNGMFYSPLELGEFIDSFKSDRVGVYLDVGNLIGYQQYPPHWIELLGKRIKRVHIKDFQENFGFVGGYSFCCLGAGQVPWPETMSALRSVGYDDTLVAEMLPWDPCLLARTSAEMDVIMAM